MNIDIMRSVRATPQRKKKGMVRMHKEEVKALLESLGYMPSPKALEQLADKKVQVVDLKGKKFVVITDQQGNMLYCLYKKVNLK